jgi:hypothetical protein
MWIPPEKSTFTPNITKSLNHRDGERWGRRVKEQRQKWQTGLIVD